MPFFHYTGPECIVRDEFYEDHLGKISLENLPDPTPQCEVRLVGATPLAERLFRIALYDVESNIVEVKGRRTFGAGTNFRFMLFLRDIAYSGLLSLNKLYPEYVMNGLRMTREMYRKVGFRVPKGYVVQAIDAPWVEMGEDESFEGDFFAGYPGRQTDDVVWLWCAATILEQQPQTNENDWRWLLETGEEFYTTFYNPWYDNQCRLFKGQASYVDVHFADHKTTGYPLNWSVDDCVLLKATSTNCLHYKGMCVLADAARRLGREEQASKWLKKAIGLREAILTSLRRKDGTFEYYIDQYGSPSGRQHAFGTALAVLTGVVEGDNAARAFRGYPISDRGIPLFHPFFPHHHFYHNNTSWPFVDSFFIKALEITDGINRASLQATLVARTCGRRWETPWDYKPPCTIAEKPSNADDVGSFHELVHFPSGKPTCSGRQLWTAAAFLDAALRSGLV